MTEENPISEQVLEHWLLKALAMKEEGKNIDDLIDDLKAKLKIIKFKKYEQIESELTC